MGSRTVLSFAAAVALSIHLAVFGLFFPERAVSQDFCGEPVMPYCVNQFDELDSILQIDRCRKDLEAELKEVAEYMECAKKRGQELRGQLSRALEQLKKLEEDTERKSE